MDFYSKQLFIYVNNEEVKEKFPSAEIHAILLDDPDAEYYFFITDNRSLFGKVHYSTNISLKNEEANEDASEDEEDSDFDFDVFDDCEE